jgi:hypothetical protein
MDSFVVNGTRCDQKPYSIKSSTTVLAQHLRKVHSIKENGADVSAGSIERYCVRVASEEPSAAADQSILTLVLDKSLSTSVLDSDSWKTAVKCIQRAGPTYNTPASSTVNGKLLPEAVIDMKALLRKELQDTMISDPSLEMDTLVLLVSTILWLHSTQCNEKKEKQPLSLYENITCSAANVFTSLIERQKH